MVFVICEVGWEYDDENYYRPECDGVTPKKAYRNKEKAQAECDRLNGEWLRGEGKSIRTDADDDAAYGYEVVSVEEVE